MILFRYISRQVLVTMLAVTVIVLVISMGSRFSGYLNEAASGTLSKDVLFLLIAYRIPKFLELIIPVSFFLSIMLVYGRMYVDSEMVVLESCGMSPRRLIGITLSLSLIVIGLAAAVTLWLKPMSESGVEALFAGQRNLTEFDTLAPGRFQTLRSGRRVTYAEKFTDQGNLSKVFINEYKESNSYGSKDVITVVSETGETEVDEQGNRFLVLRDGYRYRGSPGHKSYQVIQYEEYGQLLDKEVSEKRRPQQTAVSMNELLVSSEPRDIAEWQWRVSMIIIIPIVALMALPLSKVNPRQGRFGRLLPGMILCFLYVIALSSARSSLGRGNLPIETGILWIHGIFVVIVFLLFRLDQLTDSALRLSDRVRSV